MLPVIDLVIQLALGVALTAAVIRRDMRRLGPGRRARAWNVASFWSAVVGFGPLCVPIHFARTRRTVAGFGLGLAWMMGVLVALGLAAEITAWVTGGG